jgi:hypothetical protein
MAMKLDRIDATGRIGLLRKAEGDQRKRARRLPEGEAKKRAVLTAQRYADEASRIGKSET